MEDGSDWVDSVNNDVSIALLNATGSEKLVELVANKDMVDSSVEELSSMFGGAEDETPWQGLGVDLLPHAGCLEEFISSVVDAEEEGRDLLVELSAIDVGTTFDPLVVGK